MKVPMILFPMEACMRFEDEFRLSCYETISSVNKEHGVSLLRHKDNGQLYVRKDLTIFNAGVYRALSLHPVPGIPRIAEVIEDGDTLIVIEEYINGIPLEQLIEQGSLTDENRILVYFTELLEILKSLHAFTPPIVHRDIKPANIIITQDDHVKLLDLNAAKYVAKGQTRDTELIGTVGYAAPEQYGFSSSDVRTDIYAAGILLNVMLTGALPQEIRPTGPLWKIIEKCTRMEPANRYQNVDEILYDLNQKLPKSTLKKARVPASRVNGPRGWKSYLPPGFRSLTWWKMMLAAPVYLLFLWLSLGFTVPSREGVSYPPDLFYRFYMFFSLIPTVFFLGNYLDIWSVLRIRKIQNRFVRFLAIIGTAALYMFTVFVFFLILGIIIMS